MSDLPTTGGRPSDTRASWANRSVLVTGASGFVGRHLSQRLESLGAVVHAVSRYARASVGDRMRWIPADLSNVDDVRRVWGETRPDVVFHLSGAVDGAPSRELLLPTFHSLLTTSVNLLAVATERDCSRLVFIGSLEESDSSDTSQALASPYAAAKNAASEYARMCHRVFATPVAIARIFMGYGPGQPGKKLIPSVIRALLRNESPALSTGHREFDWVYIDDAVDALIACACTSGLEGRTVDIGSGTLTSIRGVVERLVDLCGGQVPIEYGSLPDAPPRSPRRAETSTTRSLIGWSATTSLDEGLARTVQWFRSHPAAEDFQRS